MHDVRRCAVFRLLVNGSGNEGATDFTSASDFTLALAAETTANTGTFTHSPVADTRDESDGSVTISSASALVTESATPQITDDDAPPAAITEVENTEVIQEQDTLMGKGRSL